MFVRNRETWNAQACRFVRRDISTRRLIYAKDTCVQNVKTVASPIPLDMKQDTQFEIVATVSFGSLSAMENIAVCEAHTTCQSPVKETM